MAVDDKPADSSPSVEAGKPSDEKTEEKPEEEVPMKNYLRILSYGSRLDWSLMGLAVLCAAGSGVVLPLMNIVFGALVSHFSNFFIPGSGVTRKEFMDAVVKNVLYIIYLFIGKFVLAYISMFCLRMTGARISANLRLAYLRALFNRPISFIDELPIGRPTDTITTSSNLVQAGISDRIAAFIQSLSLVISAYAVAFARSWQLTLACSGSLLFICLVYGIVIPICIRQFQLVEKANENASSIAGEVMGSIRTIVACDAQDSVSTRHGKWMTEAKIRRLRTSPTVSIQFGTSQFATFCNFALAFWFGVRLYYKGTLSDVGPVITVIFSILIMVSAMSLLSGPLLAISKAISVSNKFFSVIDSAALKTSGLKDIDINSFENLSFNDVRFSYPSRPGVKILDGISLSFPIGRVTALVGPSGCGKSTIVGLLERWYQISYQLEGENDADATQREKQTEPPQTESPTSDEAEPNSGSIRMGPHNIDELDLKWWRTQIGFVQQEPFSFNTSVFKNVAFGLVGSKWENESDDVKRQLVKEACQEAFADEFIDKLPEGYDTLIGENGIKLSGGQRQRLAIARSIIKQPPILILDEATSSIDVRGERIVQAALDRVSRNRTTITIAHRLSTIKKADNIIVLQKGQAIEQGTHEELLSQGGLYHSLVENQQLEMGDGDEQTSVKDMPKDDLDISLSKTKTGSTIHQETDSPLIDGQKSRSLINSVGLFLWEQRGYWVLYTALVFSAACCGAGFSIQSYLFAKCVNAFQFSGSELKKQGNFWALMFFILALGTGIFYYTLGWACVSLSTYIPTIYRQEYFENVISKPISFFDQEGNSAGSVTSRLSSDPSKLEELLGPMMAFPLISVFNIMGCIAISFAFGWKLTLVSIFSAFPIIVGAMFVRVRYEVKFDRMNAAVFAESSQFAAEAIGAFRTVASLTLEDTIVDRYNTLLQDHIRAAFLKARHASLIIALSESLELPCMALCFWYGGKLMSTHEYNVVQFFVVYIAIVLGGQAAGQCGSVSPNLAQANEAANRMLNHRPKKDDTSGDIILNRPEGGVKIEFKSVQFKYPTRDIWVYKNLSFAVEKGQFAALVGPSGCGKTTVVALLERFYDYQGGSIQIDGAELKSFDVKSYRKNLSLVSQEPALYQGSVMDNVLLGVEPNSITREEVEQVCKDAEIHDFIQSLPQGYDTDVGQRGLALSGGQKQRICIARALIRDPRLLLLDEATSSLDSESEKLVQAAIERTAKGRTVVVVAHRLATVQNADVIFVFGEGGVVETGTHHGLLKKRGVYYQMCESQALDR